MDAQRLYGHLAALRIARDSAPDDAQWRALLGRLELDTLDAQIVQRERYLEAVVQMHARLLTITRDHLGAFNQALEPLGTASGASRVYLFEKSQGADGTLFMSQRAEWCASGVAPEIDNPNLQNLPFAELFPRWVACLERREHFAAVEDAFDGAEREVLGPQGIRSILVLPIHVDAEFIGFIGFDNCVSPEPWAQLEINLLSSAASQIGLFIMQRRASRELREAHAEVAAARDRALDANRAKSVFLTKISHELRTPLNAIIGYAEILLEALEDEPDGQHTVDVQRIQSAGKHLLAIINDLLDLSSAEADKLKLHIAPTNISSLVDDLTSAAQQLARRNHNEFILHLPPADQLGTVHTDRTRVHQVLLNLTSNACKYTSHGQVTLSVSATQHDVKFEIEDTGIGIPAEKLEHIFDAFAQADNSTTRVYDGTGLGLTISKHLSHLLGATIAVKSLPDQGSCFSLTIPRLADSSEANYMLGRSS